MFQSTWSKIVGGIVASGAVVTAIVLSSGFNCMGTYSSPEDIRHALAACGMSAVHNTGPLHSAPLPDGNIVGRVGPCSSITAIAYDGQNGAGGYPSYQNPYWKPEYGTAKSCGPANIDPFNGKKLALANAVFSYAGGDSPPPPVSTACTADNWSGPTCWQCVSGRKVFSPCPAR